MNGGESVTRPLRGSWVRRIALGALTFVLIYFAWGYALRLAYPQPYREEVERYAKVYQLDPLLVTAVMRVESGFDPEAVSPRGARGLMQIMPDTGIWAAEQMKIEPFDVEMLFDPETNVAMGVWYLSTLRQLFEGETVLALAAYNGGRSNVLRWLDEESWSGQVEEIENIPFPETRNYVRKVLTTYERYRAIWGPSP